jgi:hypothetical protein
MLFNLSEQIAKSLQCPDCNIDMDFLASVRTNRVFVSTILERVFFLCPNCQRLSHRLVAMPLNSIMGQAAQRVNTGNAEPCGILQNNRTEAP